MNRFNYLVYIIFFFVIVCVNSKLSIITINASEPDADKQQTIYRIGITFDTSKIASNKIVSGNSGNAINTYIRLAILDSSNNIVYNNNTSIATPVIVQVKSKGHYRILGVPEPSLFNNYQLMCKKNIIVNNAITYATLSLHKTDPVVIKVKIIDFYEKPLCKGSVYLYENISELIGGLKRAIHVRASKKLMTSDEGVMRFYGRHHGKYRLTHIVNDPFRKKYKKDITVNKKNPISIGWKLKKPPLITISYHIKTTAGLCKFNKLGDIFCETYNKKGEVVDRWMHGIGDNNECNIVLNKEGFHFIKNNRVATKLAFELPFGLRDKYKIVNNESVELTADYDQEIKVIVELK